MGRTRRASDRRFASGSCLSRGAHSGAYRAASGSEFVEKRQRQARNRVLPRVTSISWRPCSRYASNQDCIHVWPLRTCKRSHAGCTGDRCPVRASYLTRTCFQAERRQRRPARLGVRELRPSWAWSCVAPVDDAGEAPAAPYEIARMEVAVVEDPGLGCHRGQESIQTGRDAFDRRVCQEAFGGDGGEVESVDSMGSAQRLRYRFER